MGLRFSRLGNDWGELIFTDTESEDVAHVTISDENGTLISGVIIKVLRNGNITSTAVTDTNGIAIVTGKVGETYTLQISGTKIESKTISGWEFRDLKVEVVLKKYLEIDPDYIWLTKGNNYIDNVDVMSNVIWNII